jgi:hypothetical protein
MKPKKLKITNWKRIKLRVSGGGPCIPLRKKLDETNIRLEEKLQLKNIFET